MRYAIREVITRVFPLPAPAITNAAPEVFTTAFCCSELRCANENEVEVSTALYIKRNYFYWHQCNTFTEDG
jgi:hypothetical protein